MNKEPKTDSLKNQSENFNENFTQEKEQIIIDETECKDYDNGCCEGSCYSNSVSIVKSCDPENMRCDFYVNKLKEQLARQTQELYFARNEVHSKTEYIREQRDIIDKLKQKYEQLQEKYEALKLENQEGYEIVAELKQECEELKGKYKNVLDLAKQNADANEYCLQELEQENYRYRKALEEIEAATKINCEEICGRKFADCNDTSCLSAEVLDIINKAKGKVNDIIRDV